MLRYADHQNYRHLPVLTLITPTARNQLSNLCIHLRGAQTIRKMTELTGIAHSAWSSWENGKGSLGKSNAKRLADYVGTTEEELQLYLNGGCSLQEYLQIPEAQSVSQSMQPALSVKAVLLWMEDLSLSDLAQIMEKGGQLIHKLVAGSGKSGSRKKQAQQEIVNNQSIAELVREHRAVVLEAFLDVNMSQPEKRIEAILRGETPNPSEIALFTQILPISSDELYRKYLQEYRNANGVNQGCKTSY